MINLGKIVFFIFFIPQIIYAGVTASVDLSSPTKGETVTLRLSVSGENIKRPSLYTLCGEDIISTSSQTSIRMINGDYQKSYNLSYQFVPQKSCTIEPIEVEIDGVAQKSNALSITVKPMRVAKDSAFALILTSDKKEVYIGEEFEVVLIFKQRRDANAVDSKFIAPELKGFWVKDEANPEQFQDGNYAVRKIKYRVSAQRVGLLSITPAQIKIASRDSKTDSWGAWIPQVKWRTYISNQLDIKVKELPTGIDLVGDFSIESSADKIEINAGEAVNVKVKVKGKGNLEDIESFKPYINGVSIFDEKISLKPTRLSQKLAFIADEDFTIPSFTLKYFNPKTKEIKIISTKEIKVKVNGSSKKAELNIKRDENHTPLTVSENKDSFSLFWTALAFFIGVILGIVGMLFKNKSFSFKEKRVSIKDPKRLLIKLLPYKDDEIVQEMIHTLENNLYSNTNIEVDKKVLKDILHKYDIN